LALSLREALPSARKQELVVRFFRRDRGRRTVGTLARDLRARRLDLAQRRPARAVGRGQPEGAAGAAPGPVRPCATTSSGVPATRGRGAAAATCCAGSACRTGPRFELHAAMYLQVRDGAHHPDRGVPRLGAALGDQEGARRRWSRLGFGGPERAVVLGGEVRLEPAGRAGPGDSICWLVPVNRGPPGGRHSSSWPSVVQSCLHGRRESPQLSRGRS